jgi:hypothetical protein
MEPTPTQTLKLKSRVDRDGHLRLDVPTALPTGEVELVLVIESVAPAVARGEGYDFSDLAGRLRWSGDAVKEQRALRHEWPA